MKTNGTDLALTRLNDASGTLTTLAQTPGRVRGSLDAAVRAGYATKVTRSVWSATYTLTSAGFAALEGLA